ncbi:MAG: hypothetical protein O7F12_16945 [Nitrospirae bacterium]|nr:hypothetical protein [Nitrospirota bacterium]
MSTKDSEFAIPDDHHKIGGADRYLGRTQAAASGSKKTDSSLLSHRVRYASFQWAGLSNRRGRHPFKKFPMWSGGTM